MAATSSGTVINAPAAIAANQPGAAAKNQPLRVMKTLSENKLKRLNILTYINDKKEILFTKKAFKFEKERIWREIFLKMRDSGMVSPEKDWRYVRDVSFSNWRKRAQKRLKHLAANGYRINMDECEFLISDILGHTPDRKTFRAMMARNGVASGCNNHGNNFGGNKTAVAAAATIEPDEDIMDEDEEDDAEEEEEDEEDEDEEESDEDMIDSDEDDVFDQMLLVPKVVMNDDVPERNNSTRSNQNIIGKLTAATKPNGNCINGKPAMKKCPESELGAQNKSPAGTITIHRLEQLEIENKILKNRYMKLKIYMLEKNLGLNHCNEVKDLN